MLFTILYIHVPRDTPAHQHALPKTAVRKIPARHSRVIATSGRHGSPLSLLRSHSQLQLLSFSLSSTIINHPSKPLQGHHSQFTPVRLHARIKEHPLPLGIYSNPRSRTTELSLVRQLRLHFHARSASVWTTRIIQQAFACPFLFPVGQYFNRLFFSAQLSAYCFLLLSTHWLALLHYPPFSQIFRVPLRLHHNNNIIINCMLLCLLSPRFPGSCCSLFPLLYPPVHVTTHPGTIGSLNPCVLQLGIIKE